MYIKEHTGVVGQILTPFWFVLEMLANGIDDLFIIFSAYMSFSMHMDIYSLALFVGKCFKIAFQFYIEGLLF